MRARPGRLATVAPMSRDYRELDPSSGAPNGADVLKVAAG